MIKENQIIQGKHEKPILIDYHYIANWTAKTHYYFLSWL